MAVSVTPASLSAMSVEQVVHTLAGLSAAYDALVQVNSDHRFRRDCPPALDDLGEGLAESIDATLAHLESRTPSNAYEAEQIAWAVIGGLASHHRDRLDDFVKRAAKLAGAVYSRETA